MSTDSIASIIFGGAFALIIIWGIGLQIYNKSRGTISVLLDKFQFSRGEKIAGKAVINLKKVIHAQKFTVSLVASKEIMQHQANIIPLKPGVPQNQMAVNQNRTDIIFNFELPLDGEKDYLQQEYPFEIIIPKDAAATGSSNLNPAGAMIGGLQPNLRINPTTPLEVIDSRIDWNIRAHLYISGKPDLSGATQINVD